MHGTRQFCGGFVALMAAALVACGDDPKVCRADYLLVAGQPSTRFDVFTRDGDAVVRALHPDGARRSSSAIYYYFDADGRLSLEALDDRFNGDIEARMDGQPRLFEVLTPYIVDMDLQDDSTDALQLSLEVPTSLVLGAYNPGRLLYQLPCDQEATSTEDAPGGGRRVLFTPVGPFTEGAPGATMDVIFDPQGRPARWAVDDNSDGVVDDVASIYYNEFGLVTEVSWLRSGRFLGKSYATSRWTYDTQGRLYEFESDADGDGQVDNRVRYSAPCFRSAP